MVIRVSGYPGAGKTTLCKHLAEALRYPYHYSGGIFRELAKEKGMTIEEFYAALENDPELEKSVDQKSIELMREHYNLIMEGRMAPFLPCPFKTVNILLTVTPEESARRGLLRPENAGRSLEEMQKQTEERVMHEYAHYKKLYGIANHFDPAHYQIVIDTTHKSPEEVFATVIRALQ